MNLLTLSSLLFVAGASAQYYDYSLNGSEKCALINVAMDESGSMDREQSFLKTNVLENIITELQGTSNNFTKVFVCSNGFGNLPSSYAGVDSDGFRRLGCSLGYDPNILNWGSSSAGTHEDGYTAIIKSIDRVTAFIANLDLAQTCKTMSKNFILVSDEDRDMHIADAGVTQVTVKDRIALREYVLNLVVNVHIIDQETHYLGMRYNYDPAAVFVAANPPSFPNDIFKPTKQISGAFDGGYEVVTTYTDKSYNGAVEGLEQGYLETGSGKTVRDYAPLIENTEGAIWSIPSLRYGGRLADNNLDDSHRQAFIDAFIKVKVCEIANCRGEVGSNGDPHFTTWKNEHYEFHGQCDLVLAKDSQSLFGSLDMGFNVHIRTKIVRFWSYIQSVAIRIGNDVLEIRGNADSNNEPMYWFNYEYQGDMTTLSGFPVTHYSSSVRKRSYLIDLSSKKPGYSIQVDLYREFVGVKLNGNKNGYRNTVGLLGDPSTGKMLARDGSTEMLDYTDFGNEWQVRPFEQKLFHEMADPQFPIGCIQPEDPRGERRRRLAESSIGMEEAEIACASLHDPASVKDCVYDILSTQDLDMVGAY